MSDPGTRELDRAAFASVPGSFVPCPLKGGAQIAAGRCVEWQGDNGCHCEHALPSLRRVEKHLVEPARKASPGDAQLPVIEQQRVEQLDGVRGLIVRAEAMERARPTPHPAPLPPRPPSMPARRAERVAEIEQDIERRLARVRAPQQKPAEPAKESKMAELGTCRWTEEPCSVPLLRRSNKSGLCKRHRRISANRRMRARKAGKPLPGLASAPLAAVKSAPPPSTKKPARKKPRLNGKRILPPPRTFAAVAAKHTAPRSAPPADVITMLEQRLAHHVEQVSKYEKALAALRS